MQRGVDRGRVRGQSDTERQRKREIEREGDQRGERGRETEVVCVWPKGERLCQTRSGLP
jgi:hypothetical protein